jgi:molybdopterin converting factor subunit 1
MTLTVLYFAAVRDLVGVSEERLEFGGGTISDFAAFIAEKHEPLKGRLASVRFARNESFATNDERLEDGDTIALIPPVAGG